MQIKETIKHYPVFEISDFNLPKINFNQTNLSYNENLLSSVSNKRKEITDIPEDFLTQWHAYGKEIQNFITDPSLKKECEEIGASWFGRNEKFRWNKAESPRILIDSPSFNMMPHIDNRVVFCVLIINLEDNPAGTGTQMLSPFGKKEEVLYQGPTQKGTGILMFNSWNTWHKIENYSNSNRYIAYQTMSIDDLNLNN